MTRRPGAIVETRAYEDAKGRNGYRSPPAPISPLRRRSRRSGDLDRPAALAKRAGAQ